MKQVRIVSTQLLTSSGSGRISPTVLATLFCIGGEADLGCDSDLSSVTLLSVELLRGCYLCSGLEFRVQAAHRKKRHRPQRHRATRKMAANFTKQQSRDQSMNETTDEHRFICGVVQSTTAPKKDLVLQVLFFSRLVRSS